MPRAHEEVRVRRRTRTRMRRPPMYRVIMLNDDYTPMDFVVGILMAIFQHPRPRAEALMWKVHTEGAAVVGVYPRDIAESKIMRTHQASRAAGHPLRCIMERDDADR
ncbi:MAG: ATP-dependent Clp protease adapter ClpS [Zetaproteobacteria bacterium]|nr:MAG: ATP-dependent Clp protease adapter ClpS [Zetaproteobacteria bacterium]